MKNCVQCNTQFDEKDYRQKFCSHSCSATHSNARRLRTHYKHSTRTCQVCNKSLLNHQKSVCSTECRSKWRWMISQRKIEQGKKVSIGVLRKYLDLTREHKCEICQGTVWFNRPMPLVMDHIDGNASNNLPSNLRWVCPNCDRFSPTFGNRNKGFGRKSRGILRYDTYRK